MDAQLVDWRAQRGLRLLKDKGASIRKVIDNKFLVPSQSGAGSYLVDITTETERCSCPDWESRAAGLAPDAKPPRCKHVWTVLLREKREFVTEEGSFTVERRTRMDWSWSAYRQARGEEKERAWQIAAELCGMLPPQPYAGTGRHALRRGNVLFAGFVRGYECLAQDRCKSDLKSAQKEKLIDELPHFNTVYTTLRLPSAHDDLRWLLKKSVEPFHAIEHDFAMDATGISRNIYFRWFDHKWGRERKERKIQEVAKLHVGIGLRSRAIAAIDVSTGNRHDGPFLRNSLLPQCLENFADVRTVFADAAYSSHANRQALARANVDQYIDFASNATYGRDPIWNQCLGESRLKRDLWLSIYHQRSIVEAFFSSYKRVFGVAVRAKTHEGAVAEILCRAFAHNLRMLVQCMFMLGIEPRFTPPQPPAVIQ